jgi:hypothetical protein
MTSKKIEQITKALAPRAIVRVEKAITVEVVAPIQISTPDGKLEFEVILPLELTPHSIAQDKALTNSFQIKALTVRFCKITGDGERVELISG